MKTIKINTKKLLDAVRENRIKHITEYNEALVGWRKSCIEGFEKELTKARNGEYFSQAIDVVRPHSYEEDYNKVISMLEWTEDEVTELEPSEFDQYVNDNWSWQRGFKTINSSYLHSK